MNSVEGAEAEFTEWELTQLVAWNQMMHVLFWDFSVAASKTNLVEKLHVSEK